MPGLIREARWSWPVVRRGMPGVRVANAQSGLHTDAALDDVPVIAYAYRARCWSCSSELLFHVTPDVDSRVGGVDEGEGRTYIRFGFKEASPRRYAFTSRALAQWNAAKRGGTTWQGFRPGNGRERGSLLHQLLSIVPAHTPCEVTCPVCSAENRVAVPQPGPNPRRARGPISWARAEQSVDSNDLDADDE